VRALLPYVAEDVDVHAYYAHGWSDRGGWRVNFVSSADGAVSVGGRSAGLQTAGDNRIFTALRDLADAVVVGAGTANAEGYRPARRSPARTARRREFGFAETLPVAVVSGRLNVNPDAALYAPGRGTLVLTCAAAPADTRAALAGDVDVIICGEDEVDLATARAALASRGLERIVCEGGPHLFTDAVRAGVVDEFCLSLTPMLVGPGPGHLMAGMPLADRAGLRLLGLLEEDGAVFCRYAVDPADGSDRG
jgi:riboflavin biosynthesis pyrimidine reductase